VVRRTFLKNIENDHAKGEFKKGKREKYEEKAKPKSLMHCNTESVALIDGSQQLREG
jgi:hypothetical protein